MSVFNGSIFEASPYQPVVLLKLIYHWACQTNVYKVRHWVKVDNVVVKKVYTWLRSVCTVAVHRHMSMLGGHGKQIEVGVISLGRINQADDKRQLSVEVLGVLDNESKIVHLRAFESLNENNHAAKILEPLLGWVHRKSQILTDRTVDMDTLQAMGFHDIIQDSDSQTHSFNANIMDYLRCVLPRMFDNTLALLSLQIVQQFLDELVWRECYGPSPGLTFDNIISQIGELTQLDTKDSLLTRLLKV